GPALEEKGGLSRGSALVPRIPAIVPGRSGVGGDELPARGHAVRKRGIPGRGGRVRTHRVRLSVPREVRRGGLRRARLLRTRIEVAGRRRARRLESPAPREPAALCDDLPGPPGE